VKLNVIGGTPLSCLVVGDTIRAMLHFFKEGWSLRGPVEERARAGPTHRLIEQQRIDQWPQRPPGRFWLPNLDRTIQAASHRHRLRDGTEWHGWLADDVSKVPAGALVKARR
jgi:hypothetical protein